MTAALPRTDQAHVFGGRSDGECWPLAYANNARLEGYHLLFYPTRAVYVHHSLMHHDECEEDDGA